MRREIVFSLLGFLGGFVAAALMFWQPATMSTAAIRPARSEASSARDSAPFAAADHPGRRLVVSARENGGVSPANEVTSQPKRAAEVFHEMIGTLKDMDSIHRQAAIDSLVKQLQAAGPEGLQVLRDYFRAGQDVQFSSSHTYMNGVAVQSLRAELLNKLGDWPETLDLTREVLRTTASVTEASLAIAQLERRSPGSYRAEAIQALQILAAGRGESSGAGDGAALLGAMGQLKSVELVPFAEAFVVRNPWASQQYLSTLNALPADVRVPALQRLFANETATKEMASNPWMLAGLNYSEPVIAQNMAQIFTEKTDKKFRENFLTNFATAPHDSPAERVARLNDRLSFLDQIAPQCSTPVLQERLQDARAALRDAIVNPQTLTKTGSGALILSGGTLQFGNTAAFEAGTIEVLQNPISK